MFLIGEKIELTRYLIDMRYEFLNVDDMANAMIDVLFFVCKSLGKTHRFYDRELVVIGHEKVLAKKLMWLKGKRIELGQEYERDICCWRKVYPKCEQDIKGSSILISTTEIINNFGYYNSRSITKSINVGFWGATYNMDRKNLLVCMSNFIESISKSKRKTLSRAVLRNKGKLTDSDIASGLFKELCVIFKITFPIIIENKCIDTSFYGVEQIPTKEEERDRIIADIISSKRIIE
jgi:hypothetical protein